MTGEPYTTDARTRYCLNDTARVMQTATYGWIVQHRSTPTDTKWWYADSPFFLGLSTEQFAELKAKYEELKRPAAVPVPTPNESDDEDLELFL